MTRIGADNLVSRRAPETVRRLDSLADRLSDRFHPVLVKELRQAARGGVVAVVLHGVLAAQLLILLGAISAADASSVTAEVGREALMWCSLVLLLVDIVVIPAAFAWRLGAERAEEATNLVAITPLGAESLLTGKVKTALIVELVVFSATLPFMSLTYLLRGVDVRMIVMLGVVNGAVIVLAVVYALSIAAMARSAVGRVAAGVFIAGGLLMALLFAWSVTQAIIFMPEGMFSGAAITFLVVAMMIPAGVVALLLGVGLSRLAPVRYRLPPPAPPHPLPEHRPRPIGSRVGAGGAAVR